MSFSPVPRFSFRSITEISPGFTRELGLNFLMLDLDNTIAAYSEQTPSNELLEWAAAMADCGVELFIVSNSRREVRVKAFAETLGIGFMISARKPSPKGLLSAMETAGYNREESAFAGDQVYTDALAANRAGIASIIVHPRSLRNPFLALRYALESPFRALSRNQLQ